MLLIAGGAGVFVGPAAFWSIVLSALGLGMLVYTLIVSSGYYVERQNTPAVFIFGGPWLLTVPTIILRFVMA